MIRFSIERWSAWAPGLASESEWREWARGHLAIGEEAAPDLSAFPAMLRRRASAAGRLGLKALLGVDPGALPLVLCSRHGEERRSVELLTHIARKEPISPTEFSMSVHNAVGGLYAMATHSHAPITAIAAGPASAASGLIEAVSQLGGEFKQVVLVVFDAPLPELYAVYRDEAEQAFGWACVLGPPVGTHYSLSWETACCPESEPKSLNVEPFGLQLLRAFLSPPPASG